MERIRLYTVEALTAGGSVSVDVVIPASFRRWTIHVLPIHAGGGVPDEVVATLSPWVAGAYREEATPGPTQCPTNKATQLVRDYHVGRVQVSLAVGPTPPDGGAQVEVWGERY